MASPRQLEYSDKVIFGPFEYNDLTAELRKHGLLVRLRGQPLQILRLLLSAKAADARPESAKELADSSRLQRGSVVTREELQRTLWEGSTFVDFEHGLNAAVNRLRQALNDSADQPRYVETIPGRGYRFIAPVEFVSHPLRHAIPTLTADVPPDPADVAPSPPRNRSTKKTFVIVALVLCLLAGGGLWMRHLVERQKEVYGLEMQGEVYVAKWTEVDVRKGIDFYSQAIALDSRSASAYAGLAAGWSFLSDLHSPPHEAMERSKAAALRAIELNDSLPSAHVGLGVVKLQYDWDWSGAEREFRRAIELDPNDPLGHRLYGWMLISLGRFQTAQEEMKRGLTLEPLNDFNLMEMGLAHYFARQYDEAIEQARRAIGVDPASYWSHMVLGWAEEQRGEFSTAIQEFTEAKRLSLGEISQVIGSLGHASGLAGQRQQAIDAVAALEQLSKRSYVSPYDFALVYAGLGDKENALLWLEKAYDDRCGWLALWLKVDPKFDSLRTELRFRKLLQRIGFPSVP